MAEKCNPKYKNLQLISSFSEQRYATVQLMEQICQNDEYLKEYCDKLDYLSPPAVRKRFDITKSIDESRSYGYQLNSNSTVTFSDKDKKVIPIDFFDESLIDADVSDCVIESTLNNNNEVVRRAVLPYVQTSCTTDITSTRNLKDNGGVNTYWYVGYNKSKTYTLYPEWMRNWKDHKIPSVVRAQVFKCKKTGFLDAVSLQIATDSNWSSWGSPIYVQIWPAEPIESYVTKWDKKTKAPVYVYIDAPSGTTKQRYSKITSGKKKGQYKKDNNGNKIRKTETVYRPSVKNGSLTSIYHPLAESSFDPKFSTPGFHAFSFDNPPKVENNKYYAIVVFSPLSHWGQAPRIGGWGRNCAHTYADGDAWLSENNGRSFMRYGKNDPDTKLAYKMGKYTPQDFAFQCHITSYTYGYEPFSYTDANGETVTENYSYLYFKPIFTNPINSIEINATDSGTTTSDNQAGRYLKYEYSLTGDRNNPDEWFEISNKGNRAAITGKPTMIFVRAKMWQTSTNNADTPSIDNLTITLETDVSKEMYVRTQIYYPKSTPMLGASVWGRINTPFTCDSDEVTCTSEIIQEKVIKEHFEIITVEDVINYTYLFDTVYANQITENIKNKTNDNICTYLTSQPDIIAKLKENNIYIKPYTYDSDETLTEYLSFDATDSAGEFHLGGFKCSNSPAYPMISCTTQPTYGEVKQAYGEWYDYKVDYDTDIITFNEDRLLDMPVGGLTFEYNPLFLAGLRNEEMPLILDYFKEEFLISDEELEKKYVTLRATPVDPIRHVYVNKDTEREMELEEDVHYTVDYFNNRVHFLIINEDDNTSKIKLNDTITIVYTPNLEDSGISIGYFARRTESALKKQCKIYPNYLEYKV